MTDQLDRTDVHGELPRWDPTPLHDSLTARSFIAAQEQLGADVARLEQLFDQHDIRACEPRPVTAADGAAADAVLRAYNAAHRDAALLGAFVHAYRSTDTTDDTAQSAASQLDVLDARLRPLTGRLAAWVQGLGPAQLATVSTEADDHLGPLELLAARADHQMPETDEHLYAELATTGSASWGRLHTDVTSQLTAGVTFPDGTTRELPMAAVRGLATQADPAVRRAAYDAELRAWPQVGVACAAAMNGIKGEATIVNRRRGWSDPLDASLFANNVSRATFEAMHAAVVESLPDFHSWMRTKAGLHGHDGPLPWWDLFAPLPTAASGISWDEGIDIVRTAFASYGTPLTAMLDRALDERWMDAEARAGKVGGAFCMPFVGDRSLILLNWSGSTDAAQTTAHELGHAYHNVQLADRTSLQRRLPMAIAETASIFCETLVVEEGLGRLDGDERLTMLDVDLVGSNQVVVDIHSRFLFEREVFARRAKRVLSVGELDELMLTAQAQAYGDGLDRSTAHPKMWAVKGHYYGAHFYNWPYTYGLLFGLGLFARFRDDPERFRAGYDDILSRTGMEGAEALARRFGFDVTDIGFWRASLDVVRSRIADYQRLASR
jgi:pepF/M3 family oligoendopeptidase